MGIAPYVNILISGARRAYHRIVSLESQLLAVYPPLIHDISTLVYHSCVNHTLLKSTYSQRPAWGYLFPCEYEIACLWTLYWHTLMVKLNLTRLPFLSEEILNFLILTGCECLILSNGELPHLMLAMHSPSCLQLLLLLLRWVCLWIII